MEAGPTWIHTSELTANRLLALKHLLEAHTTARELRADPWAFASQLQSLDALGVTDSSLRWLLDHGYAEHLLETTRPDSDRRTFCKAANLCFTPTSCFVLSAAGLALAPRVTAHDGHALPGPHEVEAAAALAPRWDADRRILWLGKEIVKHYKVPARNQELILEAFEEEHWPVHLHDPLPPVPDMESKKRLHDAIYRLNHNQRKRLIFFHGDGTGSGVCWSLSASGAGIDATTDASAPPHRRYAND